MSCYHPLEAYRSLTKKTPKGKSFIAFNYSALENTPYEIITLPCSKCIGCRIDKSKEWAVRCVHEASLYDEHNCFITLTFNDEHLNESQTLRKSDFQKFMKRLRKKYNGVNPVHEKFDTYDEYNHVVKHIDRTTYPIRYFHCGEYGSQLSRPHHHACLFNFDFTDKYIWDTRKKVKLYRSESLERLWSHEIQPSAYNNYDPKTVYEIKGKYYAKIGFATVGEVNWQSAAYVARYVTKKVYGDLADSYYSRIDEETGEITQLQPEYITMSRRPGIAKRWFEKFPNDVFPKDYVTINGHKFKTPSYYDLIYDQQDAEQIQLDKIKLKRKLAILKNLPTTDSKRLNAMEKCLKTKVKTLIRDYEND